MKGLFDILGKTQQPLQDRRALIQVTLFNYLIANHDAHAKNFSFLYRRERPMLAPFYDLVCTAKYPDLSRHFALAIGGAQDHEAIGQPQWRSFLSEAGIGAHGGQAAILDTVMKPMAASILPELQALLEEQGLRQRGRAILHHVGAGLRHLNTAFGWDLPVDTDAPISSAPSWTLPS